MVLVTAIITTYKRSEEILERALLSIINQTYKNIEIIIVNDYPEQCENNKKIEKMLEKYKKEYNIKYLLMPENSGACKARNFGLKHSLGKYVGFLDDDDEWLPTKVEKMVSVFENNNDIKMVYSNAILYYVDKNKTSLFAKSTMPTGLIHNELLKRNFIGSCSFPMFSRAKLNEISGFNENMPASQDWEMYLRYTLDSKVEYIDEALIKFYIHDGDRISKNINKRKKGIELVYNEFKDEIESDKNLIRTFYFNRINIELDDMNYKQANNLLKKAIYIKPYALITNSKQLLKIIYRKLFKIKKI